MTIITFKEMKTKELKAMTLNIEDVSIFGKSILNGNTTAVFNGQFIDIYLNGKRIYQFGFTYWRDEEYYGNDGLVHVREGYELIG